eukprot:358367-Chlamydomonas_euryale.AAC.5
MRRVAAPGRPCSSGFTPCRNASTAGRAERRAERRQPLRVTFAFTLAATPQIRAAAGPSVGPTLAALRRQMSWPRVNGEPRGRLFEREHVSPVQSQPLISAGRCRLEVVSNCPYRHSILQMFFTTQFHHDRSSKASFECFITTKQLLKLKHGKMGGCSVMGQGLPCRQSMHGVKDV